MGLNITYSGNAVEAEPTHTVSLVRAPKVTKAEEDLVIPSQAAEEIDEFSIDLYATDKRNPLLKPTYHFGRLEQLVQQNNALGQNIAAYEVNIDGTGYEVVRDTEDADEIPEDDEAAAAAQDFFDECWPSRSFVTERRKLRRDQEITGNAFLEVLRSVSGKVMACRRLDPRTMRLVALDKAVPVTRVMRRYGEDVEVTIWMRERRFAQAGTTLVQNAPSTSAVTPRTTGPTVSGPDAGPTDFSKGPHTDAEREQQESKKERKPSDIIYFKEFGASRDVNKWTGDWEDTGKLKAGDRGTEIIWFTVHKDPLSPYGLPRWINQTPSVLGSRKAEELNLQFFESGGIPPIMVIVSGGALTQAAANNLRQYLRNQKNDKHMAAIIEAQSTSGQLSSPSKVDIKVERFGAEQQKDSMFEGYDSNCEKRIRSSFRLGPLFVGRTDDFNFATAFTSYIVAESQVFAPERMEFDEIINATLMRELNMWLLDEVTEDGVERNEDEPRLVFRSNPLTTTDIQNQIRGLNLAKDVADPESFISELNDKLGLQLKAPEGGTPPAGDTGDSSPEGDGGGQGNGQGGPTAPTDPAADNAPEPGGPSPQAASDTSDRLHVTKMDPLEMATLAREWVTVLLAGDVTSDSARAMNEVIKAMTPPDRFTFDHIVAAGMVGGEPADGEGTVELLAQAATCVTCETAEAA